MKMTSVALLVVLGLSSCGPSDQEIQRQILAARHDERRKVAEEEAARTQAKQDAYMADVHRKLEEFKKNPPEPVYRTPEEEVAYELGALRRQMRFQEQERSRDAARLESELRTQRSPLFSR